MKLKFIFSSLLLLFISFKTVNSQQPGKSRNLSAGAAIPAGDFSETHLIGAEVLMEYSPNRFGKLLRLPDPSVGFILSGGLSYFAGKKETVSTYAYRYGNYAFLRVYGGAILHFAKNWNTRLVAGPAISYYGNNIRFNLGAELHSTWYWKQQWGIGPSVGILKESGARPIWTTGIRGSFAF
jgi:hypothetical protein